MSGYISYGYLIPTFQVGIGKRVLPFSVSKFNILPIKFIKGQHSTPSLQNFHEIIKKKIFFYRTFSTRVIVECNNFKLKE